MKPLTREELTAIAERITSVPSPLAKTVRVEVCGDGVVAFIDKDGRAFAWMNEQDFKAIQESDLVHPCAKCSCQAVWHSPSDYYYCDKHVKRGCSCNLIDNMGEEYRDEQGRLLPCCEYDYCATGWLQRPGGSKT